MHLSSRRSTTPYSSSRLPREDRTPQSLVVIKSTAWVNATPERFRNPEISPLPTLASVRHCPG
jgi:hypothetical protein